MPDPAPRKPAREMTDEELASVECTCEGLPSSDCVQLMAAKVRYLRAMRLKDLADSACDRLDAALAKERA